MWVSMPDLKAILGDDMATTLSKCKGGVPVYIPQKADISHELAKIVGLRGMKALCIAFQGEYITVSNSVKAQKENILQMLEAGKTKRDIALICGVTERYVYTLAGLGLSNNDTRATHANPATRKLTLLS